MSPSLSLDLPECSVPPTRPEPPCDYPPRLLPDPAPSSEGYTPLDTHHAIALIRQKAIPPDSEVAAEWVQRTLARLEYKLRVQLGMSPRPNNEQMAEAMLKGLAKDLETAGKALHQAAETLKRYNHSQPALQAMLASKAARQAAREYLV